MIVTTPRKIAGYLLMLLALIVVAGGVPALAATTAKTTHKAFPSPEKAVEGFMAAVRENNQTELLAILGPGSKEIVSSGDPVADKAGREKFLTMYDEKHSIETSGANKAILCVGKEDYPFPIPIIRLSNKWVFDTKAGKEELLNRRIGRNELEVIDVLHAYVEAQRDYASRAKAGKGMTEFAQKIRSTQGKTDGLYWEAKEGEEQSPLGPLAAKAAKEGYTKTGEAPSPFHGYYFKILKAQGKHAEGGAYNYLVNGKMVLGYAMVAWPAQYGSSGVMTFIVNQNGTVYQRDLGKNTAKIASEMKAYDPDASWKKVQVPAGK